MIVSKILAVYMYLSFFHYIHYSTGGAIIPTTVFCIISSTSNNSDHTPCEAFDSSAEYHTLAYYMNHSSDYFRSYQTYVFDSGYHTPTVNFTLQIRRVKNLTLTGPNEVLLRPNSTRRAVVDCNGRPNSFLFSQFSNIVIKSLTFTSCLSQYTTYKRADIGLATLAFKDGANLSLLSVAILASADEAFLILDVMGNVIIHDVEVANSKIAGQAQYQSGNGITYRNCHHDSTPTNVYIVNSKFFNNSNFVQQHGSLKQAINAGGLSIDLKCRNIRIVISNVTMSNNTGNVGGHLGISFQSYSNVSVEIINSCFEGGNSPKGGGMFVTFIEAPVTCKTNFTQYRFLHISNTTFTNNIATTFGGGGIFVKHMQTSPKCNVTESATFENVIFSNNSVNSTYYGGGIAFHSINYLISGYVFHKSPQFRIILNDCKIYDSHVRSHERGDSGTGAIFVNSNLFFQLNNTAIFNNGATGIVSMNSNIILSNDITIVNNNGISGGGMLLCQNAIIYLEAYTTVTIKHNSAENTGGGICIETSDYIESQEICFFQLGYEVYDNFSLIKTITVSLHNNYAHLAGHNIFGGSIDQCYLIHGPKNTWAYQSLKVYYDVFRVPRNKIPVHPSSVSSPPRRVCSCQRKNKLNCGSLSHFSQKLKKFPGETFSINAVLVGQFNGTVPGTVLADLKSTNSSLEQGENVQNLSSITCNQLRYTISTINDHEVLEISVQRIGGITGFIRTFQKYTILVEMKDCPLGFTRTDASCDCSLLLIKNHVSCDITTQKIKRLPPVWIGSIESDKGSKIIAFHSNCPFDYCKNTKIHLLSTNNSLSEDNQCAFNRTGVLCGSCAEGLSSVFGSSECRSCSNYWLLLYIPFALIGIAFLVILIAFNITIAEGTLSGIIFYCNVIMNNISIFFPGQGQNILFLTPLVKVFLSLINLELGAPTCLFNGMDSYIKAWLDFTFPLYLWFLTGVFIFLGGKCSWIVRHNAVKVLATLILLSYTRLLSTIAAALQATNVQLEGGRTEVRWLIDGSMKYFGTKHILLVVFAVMFGLLLLPFALVLFSIQWLQKASDCKLFCWVNRLKPFFDVYTGPFTSRGRFWTGLLLLTRVSLHVVTAVNVNGDPKTVLGAITMAVLLLFLVVGLLPTRLYRRKHLNALEYASLINLGILASLLSIFNSYTIISHVSVCIELVMFIGIFISHFIKLQKFDCCLKKFNKLWSRKIRSLEVSGSYQAKNDEPAILPDIPHNNEDREPLLANISDEEQNNTTIIY